MAADRKEIKISVTPELEEMLSDVKREHFRDLSQAAMLRELIVLGISKSREEEREGQVLSKRRKGVGDMLVLSNEKK